MKEYFVQHCYFYIFKNMFVLYLCTAFINRWDLSPEKIETHTVQSITVEF